MGISNDRLWATSMLRLSTAAANCPSTYLIVRPFLLAIAVEIPCIRSASFGMLKPSGLIMCDAADWCLPRPSYSAQANCTTLGQFARYSTGASYVFGSPFVSASKTIYPALRAFRPADRTEGEDINQSPCSAKKNFRIGESLPPPNHLPQDDRCASPGRRTVFSIAQTPGSAEAPVNADVISLLPPRSRNDDRPPSQRKSPEV